MSVPHCADVSLRQRLGSSSSRTISSRMKFGRGMQSTSFHRTAVAERNPIPQSLRLIPNRRGPHAVIRQLSSRQKTNAAWSTAIEQSPGAAKEFEQALSKKRQQGCTRFSPLVDSISGVVLPAGRRTQNELFWLDPLRPVWTSRGWGVG
jgi:hypothetical protein